MTEVVSEKTEYVVRKREYVNYVQSGGDCVCHLFKSEIVKILEGILEGHRHHPCVIYFVEMQ